MAKALSRFSTAILVVVVAAALGGASTRTDGGHLKVIKKGTNAVVVGPKAKDISIDELRLSKGNQEVAFWSSDKKSKLLSIEFEKEVFENMTQLGNGRYQVNCKGRFCLSDDIKIAYNAGGDVYNTYKYWQVLVENGGTPDVSDGIIIIDP
jgi:hypothetical protein